LSLAWSDDGSLALQLAELSNLSTHLTLRNLRPPGTRTRAIPHGYGFGLVSCPNYFFESVAWAAVAYMSGSWAGKSPYNPQLVWS